MGLQPALVAAATNPVSGDEIRANVRSCLARGLPALHGATPPHGGLFSIVGSGPSVADYLDAIRSRPKIFAAGSANRYLLSQGIVPHWTVVIDPLPVMADFLVNSHPDTQFLVASQCNPRVFDVLSGNRVHVFHASVGVDLSDILPKPHTLYGGGNTVVLRAFMLGFALGYRDFEIFGFDCCLIGRDRHAVPEMNSLAAQDEQAIIANIEGRDFLTTPGLLSMALCYRDQAALYGDQYRITLHGDGIPAWMHRSKVRQEKKT